MLSLPKKAVMYVEVRTNRTTVFVNSTVVSDLKIRSVCNIDRHFVLSLYHLLLTVHCKYAP